MHNLVRSNFNYDTHPNTQVKNALPKRNIIHFVDGKMTLLAGNGMFDETERGTPYLCIFRFNILFRI